MGRSLTLANVIFLILFLVPPPCWSGAGTQPVKTEPGFVDLAAGRIGYACMVQIVRVSVPYTFVSPDGKEQTKYRSEIRRVEKLQIHYSVKNAGTRTFRAESGQAVARLVELPPGDRKGGKVIAERPITLLPAGSTSTVQVTFGTGPLRTWAANPHAVYQLRIVYRDDILSDSRTDNDDRNRANDILECDGSLIKDVMTDKRERRCESQPLPAIPR